MTECGQFLIVGLVDAGVWCSDQLCILYDYLERGGIF